MPLKFRARGSHEPQPTIPVSSRFPQKKTLATGTQAIREITTRTDWQ